MTAERCAVAYVQKRNGAWLVSLALTELTDDLTSDEMFDAASSLRVAQRIARDMALEVGYLPGWRWHSNDGWYELEGRLPAEIDR